MLEDKKAVDRILTALGEQLAVGKSPPVDMLICGGAALNLLDLVGRSTVDIDVLAFVIGGQPKKAKPFPEYLEKAVAKVARDFRLPEWWLNSGPTSALDFGLPKGTLERAETRDYGKALKVRILSRYDQIHFKLYAAVDQGGKHYDDLLGLKPSAEELEAAANWSMTHDASEGFKFNLKKLLKDMGHDNVAGKL